MFLTLYCIIPSASRSISQLLAKVFCEKLIKRKKRIIVNFFIILAPFMCKLSLYNNGFSIKYYYVQVFIYFLLKNLDIYFYSITIKSKSEVIMKRQRQRSKAEYLAKYDKSMQPLGSLGGALVPYTLLVLSFVAILIANF